MKINIAKYDILIKYNLAQRQLNKPLASEDLFLSCF